MLTCYNVSLTFRMSEVHRLVNIKTLIGKTLSRHLGRLISRQIDLSVKPLTRVFQGRSNLIEYLVIYILNI